MMRPSASGKQRDWTHHESAVGANQTSCDVRFSVVIGGKADLLGRDRRIYPKETSLLRRICTPASG